ncbi:hypothetical protein V8E36_008001 [Tilletia maclaganii]
MRLPRRTPYLHSAQTELRAVYTLLYSSDPQDRLAGLDRISLWLNRSACPYAVENTAGLVEAQLAEQRESASRSESMASRLSLNMAIVRFVNSLVDSYQTGMFAAPVKTIAMRVGLPLWLVELRHAGTHDELPSLEALRTACDIALRWLETNFWLPSIGGAEVPARQSRQEPPSDERPTTENPVATGFESALDAMRRRIEEAERSKNASAATSKKLASESAQSAAGEDTREALPRGWRRAPPDWRPSPIGMLGDRIPDLDLPQT